MSNPTPVESQTEPLELFRRAAEQIIHDEEVLSWPTARYLVSRILALPEFAALAAPQEQQPQPEREALRDWCITEAEMYEQQARDHNNGGFGIDEESIATARTMRQVADLLAAPAPLPVQEETRDEERERLEEVAYQTLKMVSELYPGFDRQSLDAVSRAMQERYGSPANIAREAVRRSLTPRSHD